MSTTIWRWSAGVALGCAAIAALLLPFPPALPQTWMGATSPALTAETARLSQAVGETQAAVREYRNAQALDRWSATASHGDTMLVRVDPTVPSAVASELRAIVAAQWGSLAVPVSAAHAEVYLYVDSSDIRRPSDASGATGRRRALEPAFVDVSFALPPATDQRRCVSLVRLHGTSARYVGAVRSQSVVGVCGFYAAFGLPGSRLQRWLAATSYRFARHSDWSVARPPVTDPLARYALGGAAAHCLTGTPAACLEALQIDATTSSPRPTRRLAWVFGPRGAAAMRVDSVSPTGLGDAEGALFADMARSLGPDRFARFWQADEAPETTFAQVAGVELDTWTEQWLARTYGDSPGRPTPSLREVLWLAVALPFALLVAVRPRQLVLGAR